MTQREQIAQLQVKECTYPIYEGVNTIGRNAQARVNVKNMSISQNHALIIIIKNSHYICDLNSSNGSYLETTKLQPFVTYEIENEQEVSFGTVKGTYVCKGPFTKENIPPFYDASQSYFAATQIMDEEPQRKQKKPPQVTVEELKPPSPLPLDITEFHDDFLPMLESKGYTEEMQLQPTEVSEPQKHENPTQLMQEDDDTDDETDDEIGTLQPKKRASKIQDSDDSTNSEELFRCNIDSDSDEVIPVPKKRSNVMIISSQEDTNLSPQVNPSDVILPAPVTFGGTVTPSNQSMNDSDFVPATQEVTRSSKLKMGRYSESQHSKKSSNSEESFRLGLTEMMDDDLTTQKNESVYDTLSAPTQRIPEIDDNVDEEDVESRSVLASTTAIPFKAPLPILEDDFSGPTQPAYNLTAKHSESLFGQSELSDDDDFVGPTQKWEPRKSSKPETPSDDFVGPTQKIDFLESPKTRSANVDGTPNTDKINDSFIGPSRQLQSIEDDELRDPVEGVLSKSAEPIEDDDFMGPTQKTMTPKPTRQVEPIDDDFMGPTQKIDTPKSTPKPIIQAEPTEDDDFMGPTQKINTPKPTAKLSRQAEDDDFIGFTEKSDHLQTPRQQEPIEDEDFMGPTQKIDTPKPIKQAGATEDDDFIGIRQQKSIEIDDFIAQDSTKKGESPETESRRINEAPTQALDEISEDGYVRDLEELAAALEDEDKTEKVEEAVEKLNTESTSDVAVFTIPEVDKKPKRFQFKRKIHSNLQPPPISPKQELQVKLERSMSPKSDTLNHSLTLLQSKLVKTRKTTSSSEIYLTVPKGRRSMVLKPESESEEDHDSMRKIKEETITPKKRITKEKKTASASSDNADVKKRKSVRSKKQSADIEVSSESDVPEARASLRKKRLSKDDDKTSKKPVREDIKDLATEENNELCKKPSTSKRTKGANPKPSVAKEASRSKRGQSVSKDSDPDPKPSRTRRGQSVAKEDSSQDSSDALSTRRKRASSVPKEETSESDDKQLRKKRGATIPEEVEPEETVNVKQEPKTPLKRVRGNVFESPDSKRLKISSDESILSSPNRERRKQRPKVVFTMFSSPQMETMVKRLGGSMVDSVEQSTVLVTEKVKRTQKLLMAIAMGKPICPPQWIVDSKKKGEFLDPMDYILQDLEAENNWKFSLKESILRGKSKLLENKSFLIQITNGADVLKGAIEACGGKCLSKAPSGDGDGCFVISSPDNKAKYTRIVKKSPAVKVIEAEAIFDGVLRQELRFDRHYL